MLVRFLAILAFLCSPVLAKELVIKVTPVEKITTSCDKLQEGDYVKFKVIDNVNDKIKKDDIVTGLITYYEPNGYWGKEAMISIENFVTENNIKLNGAIYVKGNQHNQFMEFKDIIGIPGDILRGGEAHLKPDKHVFLLYLEK